MTKDIILFLLIIIPLILLLLCYTKSNSEHFSLNFVNDKSLKKILNKFKKD